LTPLEPRFLVAAESDGRNDALRIGLDGMLGRPV